MDWIGLAMSSDGVPRTAFLMSGLARLAPPPLLILNLEPGILHGLLAWLVFGEAIGYESPR